MVCGVEIKQWLAALERNNNKVKPDQYVEEDTSAYLYNSEKHKDIRVKMYEFSSNRNSLTVELWIDEDAEKPEKEAFLSEEVSPSSITVLKI